MQGLLTDCQQETLERLVRESLANPTANRDGWDWPSDMKRLHCAVVIALLIRGLVKVADDGALIPTARGVEFSGVKPPREVRPSSAQGKERFTVLSAVSSTGGSC